MSNQQITLNDLFARAGVTTPKMSVQEIQEHATGIASIAASERGRNVIDLTNCFCADCLKGSGQRLEILPILSPLCGRDYSVVFMDDSDFFYGEDRFRTRGMCDPVERSAVLWMPCRSTRELYHEVFYQDADVDVAALVRIGAPYCPKGGVRAFYAYCTVVVSTPFQKAVERILNNLCAIARGEAPTVWEGARKVLLQAQLREVGLEHALDDLISMVRSNNDNWFSVLCSILCLRQEERRYLSQAWLSALHREREIELPCVARHVFSLSRPEEFRGVAWMHRASDMGVFSRYSDVSDFTAGLLCPPNVAQIKNLLEQVISACEPLYFDKSIWRDIAEKMAIASLVRQSKEFVAK